VTSATPQQTLRRLTIIVLLQWMGATLGLPLLPLFLEHRGGSPHIIGLIVASFFLAGVATQFSLGRLSDRIGRRPILVGGLLVYGLASMTYVLPLSAPWFTVTRMFQGSAAGAIEVASMSAVAALFAEHERGSAISKILAAQLLGIAIGPIAGVVATVRTLGWAFFVTGIVSFLAAGVAAATYLGDVGHDEPLTPLRWSKQLIGALFAAATTGVSIGVYETCWSMLMHAHHASQLQIRLSWTLFCIPWVALSRVGGWIADHWNRKAAALLGLANGAIFLTIYPHCHNNALMPFIGSFESIGAALTSPSIGSLLTQGATDREFGRRQGLSATAQTAALAATAVAAGFLFTIDPALPFTLVAVVAGLLTLCTAWWWRDVSGRNAAPR
jgi:DHA1 family multidrug resistance protein-like MFS transporter